MEGNGIIGAGLFIAEGKLHDLNIEVGEIEKSVGVLPDDDAVQFQKGQHRHNTNALIAIDKRMILYQ